MALTDLEAAGKSEQEFLFLSTPVKNYRRGGGEGIGRRWRVNMASTVTTGSANHSIWLLGRKDKVRVSEKHTVKRLVARGKIMETRPMFTSPCDA